MPLYHVPLDTTRVVATREYVYAGVHIEIYIYICIHVPGKELMAVRDPGCHTGRYWQVTRTSDRSVV